jgi:hypothetical protein
MALSTARIIGRQLTVTADGAKTIWDTVSLNFTNDTDDATASDSTLNEVVNTTKMVEGTVSGWLGSVNNGGTLPAIGDAISDLAIAVSTDAVIPSLTSFTNIKVTKVSYDFKKGPATFSFDFRSGVLN